VPTCSHNRIHRRESSQDAHYGLRKHLLQRVDCTEGQVNFCSIDKGVGETIITARIHLRKASNLLGEGGQELLHTIKLRPEIHQIPNGQLPGVALIMPLSLRRGEANGPVLRPPHTAHGVAHLHPTPLRCHGDKPLPGLRLRRLRTLCTQTNKHLKNNNQAASHPELHRVAQTSRLTACGASLSSEEHKLGTHPPSFLRSGQCDSPILTMRHASRQRSHRCGNIGN
jgi:hypothetical protein